MQSLMGSPILNGKIKDCTSKNNTVSSAPSSNSKESTILSEKGRPSCTADNKIRSVAVTSDRLLQLRKCVEDAIKDHKTFTIKGGWQTIRKQFLARGWIEKCEAPFGAPKQKVASSKESSNTSLEDVCVNLPLKQEWESQSAYVLKCERTIMSRMLGNHGVDFYWNMRREATDWQHRIMTNQTMNRFLRSLFTSKEGLNLLLQQLHWHCEPGVSCVNFPRCYTLGFPDHYNNFVDDFRITACVGLLKWLVAKYDYEDEYVIKSPEGKVPHTAVKFALDRCNEYISRQKHLDIDRDTAEIWDHEWDEFLSHYFHIIYDHALLLDSKEWSVILYNAASKTVLAEIRKYMPMIDVDGMRNIWILKPGNKCRGRGIHLVKNLNDVAKIMSLKLKYVVQKYVGKVFNLPIGFCDGDWRG